MKALKKENINSSNIATVLFFGYLFAYPLFSTDFGVLNITSFMYQMLLASSLVLIWGYCGIYSFAQAAMYGLGGYCYGIISLNIGNNALTPLAALLSVAFCFTVAAFFGYFLFYGGVNDSFIGIITLCITLAIETFLQQTAAPYWKIGRVRLNGFNGINKIPALHIGEMSLKGLPFYYVVAVTILIILIIFKLIEKRGTGYAMFSIRENPKRSTMLGYNVAKIKTLVFAFGGAIAGLAGVYYTMWGGYIVPTSMNMTSATMPIVLAAAGGRKNPIAVYIFSIIYLQFSQTLAANGTQYSYVILGALLIVVVLFVPNGIISTLFDWIDSHVFAKLHNSTMKEGKRNG